MGLPNFNTELSVMVAARCVSAQCRLCQLRPAADAILVYVKVYDGSQAAQYYCPDCYEFLRKRAVSDFKLLTYDELVPRGIHGVEIAIPAYYIKEHNPLSLYFPEPEIDLPLYRQRASKRLAAGNKSV